MGEKRLVGNASRKNAWIISACFSVLGDECLGDCQGWQSNRAGLIADANECCKPPAFLSTAKRAFLSREEQEQSQGTWQAGSDKQRCREGGSVLEPGGCIGSCVSCLQTQAICHFYLPRFTAKCL